MVSDSRVVAEEKTRGRTLGRTVSRGQAGRRQSAKAILDALNGIAYRDDKQVVSCTVRKRYTFRDDDSPRVVAHIAPMKTLAQLREEAVSDGLTGEQP